MSTRSAYLIKGSNRLSWQQQWRERFAPEHLVARSIATTAPGDGCQHFHAIRISLASPEAIRAWSYGEVTARKRSTIER